MADAVMLAVLCPRSYDFWEWVKLNPDLAGSVKNRTSLSTDKAVGIVDERQIRGSRFSSFVQFGDPAKTEHLRKIIAPQIRCSI